MAASSAADSSSGPYEAMRALTSPLRLAGTVVKGFGRGSKELGIPTANLDPEALGSALADAPAGIYFGWASVGSDATVHKMVMSIGWNPYYKNERKTVEPHLLASFPEDFYGQQLRLVATGYLRPELNFTSLQALIDAIHEDIARSRQALEAPPHAGAAADAFLRPAVDAPSAAPAAGGSSAGAAAT